MHFPRNLINVLTVQRDVKRNVLFLQNALCVSLLEAQNSIKKEITLIKMC